MIIVAQDVHVDAAAIAWCDAECA